MSSGPGRFVELHAHTTASDGTLAPAELVARAAAAGLSAIAVTDHDTMSGLEEAARAGQARGIEVVPGVEISTSHAELEIHLLGYFVDPSWSDLARRLASRRDDRDARARVIVDRLRELGVAIDYEDVMREAGDGAVGRPHVAAALVTRGHVASKQEAFDRWLADGRPAAVPKPEFPFGDAVATLLDLGAVPVVAHPGLLKRPGVLDEFPALGIAGIEVRYPKHTPEQVRRLEAFAATHRLVATGGSDFHFPGQAADLGSQRVPASVLEELRARRLLRSRA